MNRAHDIGHSLAYLTTYIFLVISTYFSIYICYDAIEWMNTYENKAISNQNVQVSEQCSNN